MLRRPLLTLAAAGLLLTGAGGTFAQSGDAGYDLMDFVNERRKLMFDMQRAYWVLLEVKNGKSDDLAAAGTAAAGMATAIDRFQELLPPGTAMGDVPGTRARPEVWTEAAAFAAAAEAFRAEAATLQATAEANDLDAFKTRFDALTGACTACHAFRPSQGGRFRFPRDPGAA